jgi:hypothetical protein
MIGMMVAVDRPREIKWGWYSRTFSNVSLSGDFMKWRLRFLTART